MAQRHFGPALALALVACLFAACADNPYMDATLIDGQWAGKPNDCLANGAASCELIIECAAKHLWPDGAPAAQARVYNSPTQMKDGTLIVYGMVGWVVAFELEDGSVQATQIIGTNPCFYYSTHPSPS